jgi:hypothetical protein
VRPPDDAHNLLAAAGINAAFGYRETDGTWASLAADALRERQLLGVVKREAAQHPWRTLHSRVRSAAAGVQHAQPGALANYSEIVAGCGIHAAACGWMSAMCLPT